MTVVGVLNRLEIWPTEAWQEFFAGCFAPDRAERPRSAADFFRRLEKALA